MSFCPDCGWQRTSTARYCGRCGRDFGEESLISSVAPETEPAELQAAEDRGRRQTTWWILVAVIVLIAAGGGAFAVVRNANKSSDGQSAALTTTPTAPASASASSLPADSPASASAAPSGSPVASLSLPPSPSPSTSPSVVSPGPGVDASPPVEVVLSEYFEGINKRDYGEYAKAETAQGLKDQPKSSFDAGYATTTDSGMTLTSLTPTGGGDLTATVTFTSRQSPADSIDDSACDAWTLNLYLVPHGDGYLIAPAPPSYEPNYSAC